MPRTRPTLLLLALLLALPFARSHAAVAHAHAPAVVALAAEKAELVDLNSASKAELMKLPAVGDAISDKIIAGRPWKSKYDLVVKKVVTRAAYEKFSRYVVARQPSAAK